MGEIYLLANPTQWLEYFYPLNKKWKKFLKIINSIQKRENEEVKKWNGEKIGKYNREIEGNREIMKWKLHAFQLFKNQRLFWIKDSSTIFFQTVNYQFVDYTEFRQTIWRYFEAYKN